MTTASEHSTGAAPLSFAAPTPMPPTVRRALFVALAAAVAAGLYLIIVRGEALLLDLSAAGGLLCL